MVNRKRRGAIVVLTAFLLVILIGMVAFSLDVGYMQLARSDLQHAADAAVLAGTADLSRGQSLAYAAAREYAQLNVRSGIPDEDVEVTAGKWDAAAREFVAGGRPTDSLGVTLHRRSVPLFFARVLGHDSFNVSADAVATFRPRDMVLVLDYSGSMNEHSRIQKLKQAVGLFFEILDSGKETDRVGFSRYSTNANLETRLTDNYDHINDEVQDSDADGYTNIGAGMELARHELERDPRPMAVKMMVLMTDGLVNRPTDRSPRGYVLDEAAAAAAAGIQMVTISFGDDADQGLMEEVAEICHGESFHVADNVGAGELGLRDIFEKIAHQRPVVLVD